jgi:hypothetical protein
MDDKKLERTLNDHKVYCPHQEKGCEWNGELRELPRHLNQDPKSDKLFVGCLFQEILCGLCQAHSCERRLMNDHVLAWCPNRDIECEYRYAGCDVKKPQEQLESHSKEAVSCHLSLVANLLQGSLSQKDNEIQELKEELSREKKQIQDLKKELSGQRKQIQEIKQQHIDLQTVKRSTEEEIRIFRGELRRERHTNHNRYWIVLLLLVIIGGTVHAFMYLHNFSSVELSSKVENLTLHLQILKEQSCTYLCL